MQSNLDGMQSNPVAGAREQVLERREKLRAAIDVVGARPTLVALLSEVDAALERIRAGTFGLCEVCHDPIEADRFAADPLVRFCLDHLSPHEQRALEKDLELAERIQRGLLPDVSRVDRQWEAAYHYAPAGLVSGDYCDLVQAGDVLYFMMGDVSGKGVAAATLMAHLHALFHALVPVDLPLVELVARASRLFCESTLPMHYATLVVGRATPGGEVDICNAGHLPALIVRRGGEVLPIDATGMPLGMFSTEEFGCTTTVLEPGDAVLLFTDGVTEAEDADGRVYGVEGLIAALHQYQDRQPPELLKAAVADVAGHRGRVAVMDDVSMMVVRRR